MGQTESIISSKTAHLLPQGSILGPLLFSPYMLSLWSIFNKQMISFRCYADDTQMYLPLKNKTKHSLENLMACLEDIKTRMSINFLKVSEDNKEVLLIRPPDISATPGIEVGSLLSNLNLSVRNVRVILVSSCLHYGNSLNFGDSQSSVNQLQLVQNAPP